MSEKSERRKGEKCLTKEIHRWYCSCAPIVKKYRVFGVIEKKRSRKKTEVFSLKQRIGREIKYSVTLSGRGLVRPDGKITDLNMAWDFMAMDKHSMRSAHSYPAAQIYIKKKNANGSCSVARYRECRAYFQINFFFYG